ncbi:MAG: hydantoinase/oxoprolinase family protein, partial [Chloroflexi bacterium]|nr:hydantoinase/oxoprolinase family protein [Chloroflexota bacterium]
MHDGAFGRYRIGVDIGGTFTDIVLMGADGQVVTRKLLSSPDDYSRAIILSIRELLAQVGLDPAAAQEIVHGTTICTNAILEQKGARTGLLTTRGFRDTLEIGRLRYPRLYDLRWMKPPPLVERRLRLEVPERLDRSGQVVEPLDEAAARDAIARLIDTGIESLAICLIHSYANPAHEQRLGAFAAELAPDLPVSLSSAVLPEIGEYERSSTTVINAYLQPVVQRYLATLAAGLADLGLRAPVWVMQSNGGIMSARAAAERPIHIVESGPAGGAIAALDLARRLGLPSAIGLDMGGTTAKACIVEEGRLHQASDYEVGAGLNVGHRLNRGAGYPLRVPAIDIAEIGAGGGSLVWLDAAGLLHVGPQSAGAVPGPVCYRTGGTEPTLTDANLLLGYLNPDALLGGALPIDRAYAEEVFAARVARPLGLAVLPAAYGVHAISIANMVRVVKAISSERGRDPRQFSLVAYGGNGPVHAALVAGELGMRQVVVPPTPGLFSAFGLLFADHTHHFSRTILRSTRSLSPEGLEEVFQEMEGVAGETLAREGYGLDQVRLARALDLRYVGQSFELRLPLDSQRVTEASLRDLDERFAAEHERTYGHRAESDPVEVVNVRVTAVVGSPGGRTLTPGPSPA